LKVIVPGASTTALIASQLDVGLDFEDMASTGSGLGSGASPTSIRRAASCRSRTRTPGSSGWNHVRSARRASSDPARSRRTSSGSSVAWETRAIWRDARARQDGDRRAELRTPHRRESLLMQSLFQTFTEEFRGHERRSCPRVSGRPAAAEDRRLRRGSRAVRLRRHVCEQAGRLDVCVDVGLRERSRRSHPSADVQPGL
jgi:hypothetical protein